MNEDRDFKKILPGAIENYHLARETTMKVGGKADYFFVARTQQELINAVRIARTNKLDYLVIAGGSNIIISDEGFRGLVIKNLTNSLVVGTKEVIADSGLDLQFLLRQLAENELGGLEFLAGIPGSLGGAVFGNAGAWGKSMRDIVSTVLILDVDNKLYNLKNHDLGFSYRDSNLRRFVIQNGAKNHPVILSATLKVAPRKKEMILRTVENYIRLRTAKHPTEASSGSVFKNLITKNHPELAQKNKAIIVEDKMPTGALLERIGTKEMSKGGASIYPKHANIIINKRHRAKAHDVYELVSEIKQKFKSKYGIDLEEEIMFIGDFTSKPKGFIDRIFKR
jgi:UDP-N-acetylmuramate dehydrogenase